MLVEHLRRVEGLVDRVCLGSGLESDLLDQVAKRLGSAFDRYSQSFDHVPGKSISMRVCEVKVRVYYKKAVFSSSDLVYSMSDESSARGTGTILPDGVAIDYKNDRVSINIFVGLAWDTVIRCNREFFGIVKRKMETLIERDHFLDESRVRISSASAKQATIRVHDVVDLDVTDACDLAVQVYYTVRCRDFSTGGQVFSSYEEMYDAVSNFAFGWRLYNDLLTATARKGVQYVEQSATHALFRVDPGRTLRFDLSDRERCRIAGVNEQGAQLEERWERMDVSAGILWRFMAKI